MGTKLNKTREAVRMAITLLNNSSFDILWRKLLSRTVRKSSQEFMDYQRPENAVQFNPDNDRVFPFETVSLKSYSGGKNSELENAVIHTGPYANELAMMMNALALVIGDDIYFRNGAYQPESEEGRKVLAHELTHVAQYEEDRVTENADSGNLEKEAELAETHAEYDPDPYEPYPVDNKVYYLRKGQIEKVTKLTADKVEEWISDQKFSRTEEEYLELLCAYSDWLDEEI